MATESYDQAKKALADGQAVLVSKGVNPLTGDMELVRRFPCPTRGDARLGQQYLQNYTDIKNDVPGATLPVLTVTDPTTVGEKHPGTWRAGTITLVDTAKAVGQQEGIVQTLSLGFASTVASAWAGARLTSAHTFPTNTESVTGVPAAPTGPKTQSDNPAWVLFLRLPNIDHRQINAIAAGMHTYIETTLSGAFTIAGQAYTGMKCLISTATRADDGSAFLDVVVATARVTFNLVSNLGSRNESRIAVIHTVPADEAQAIATEWEALAPTQGKSTSIGYSAESGRCTVTLTKPGVLKDNYSTAWVQIDLHTRRRWHFAWGYTKDEIGVWVGTTHNTALTDDVATAEGAAGDDAQVRQVEVGPPRGDGFYDGVIVETRYGAKTDHTETYLPDVILTSWAGTRIGIQRDYGIRLRKHEISCAELVTRYGTTYKGIGKTVDVKITKEDQWIFDYEAVITTQSASIEGSLSLTGGGQTITPIHSHGIDLSDSDDKAALAAKLAPGIRKRVDVDLKMRDDELAEVQGTVREVPKVGPYWANTGAAGVALRIGAARNVDLTDITLPTSGVRDDVDADIELGEGGEVSAKWKARHVPEVGPLTKDTGNAGVKLEVSVGRALDANQITLPTSGVRERVEARITPAESGALSFEATKKTVPKVGPFSKDTGGAGIGVTVGAARNVDPSDVTLPTTGPRVRVNADLDLEEGGEVNAKWTRTTVQRVLQTVQAGAALAPIVLTIGGNIDPADLAFLADALAVTDIGVERDVAITPNDDGSLTLTARVKTEKAGISSPVNVKIDGPLVTTGAVFRHLASPPATGANQWVEGLALRDTNNYDGILLALSLTPGNAVCVCEATNMRERHPHFFMESLPQREVVNEDATDPRLRFKEMGTNIFHFVCEWYRDSTITTVRTYSLSKLDAEATGTDCRSVVQQAGPLWIRETRTDTIGTWTFNYLKRIWLVHITEEGIITSGGLPG